MNIHKLRLQQKLSMKALKLMTKIGFPSAQEALGNMYIRIAREDEQGKIFLENFAKIGDTDAKALIDGNVPGAGLIYLQIKAKQGDPVAQMMIGGYDDE